MLQSVYYDSRQGTEELLIQRRSGWFGWAAVTVLFCVLPAGLAQDTGARKDEKVVVSGTLVTPEPQPTPDSTTDGTVTVGGQTIVYRAVAGTLTVGSTDMQDATLDFDGNLLPDAGVKPLDKDKPDESLGHGRVMFYVAYFKKDAATEQRPVTFLWPTAGRVRRRCGCIWARSGRGEW